MLGRIPIDGRMDNAAMPRCSPRHPNLSESSMGKAAILIPELNTATWANLERRGANLVIGWFGQTWPNVSANRALALLGIIFIVSHVCFPAWIDDDRLHDRLQVSVHLTRGYLWEARHCWSSKYSWFVAKRWPPAPAALGFGLKYVNKVPLRAIVPNSLVVALNRTMTPSETRVFSCTFGPGPPVRKSEACRS